jgi:Protein of unknown function (DUF2490)
MNNFLVHILFIIFVFSVAQSKQSDAGMWSGAKITQPLPYGFAISFKQALRLKNNWTSLNQTYNDLTLSYKTNKYFSIDLNYRLSQRENTFSPAHIDQRFNLDANTSYETNKFELTWRTRVQFRYRDLGLRESSFVPKKYWRNKFTLGYELNKILKPFVYFESFNEFSFDTKEFNKYRISAGSRFRINKRNSIKIAYILQNSINTTYPLTENILRISYNYKLKKL